MKAQTLTCPRCGYDLSGQADAGRRANAGVLPSMGLCSECGLEFEWADVVNPFRNRVPGFVEHEDRWLFLSAWRTWAMALNPMRFWRRLRIEMPIRQSRIVLWFVSVLFALWALGSLACDVITLIYPFPGRSFLEVLPSHWLFGVATYGYPPFAGPNRLELMILDLPGCVLGALGASLIVPVVLGCLPHTRRLAKVRAAHVFRAGAYGLAWAAPVLVMRAAFMASSEIDWIAMTRARSLLTSPPLRWIDRALLALDSAAHNHGLIWLSLLLSWLTVWWWCVLRSGWRLKAYRRVWWVVCVTMWLAAAAAFASSSDGSRIFF